jgi:hypothetical protein
LKNNVSVMKKTIVTLLLSLFLCLAACSQRENKNEAQAPVSISLKFYPIIRYSITVNNDSLIVKNHTEKEHIIKLSKNQIDIINTLASNINMQYIYRQEVEDAWEVQMTINGIVVYEVTDYSLETLPPNEIKDLIYYLIRLSGIKVEL